MEITSLRKLVKKYHVQGLPIEKRKYLQSLFGKQEAVEILKTYDEFVKQDIIGNLKFDSTDFFCDKDKLIEVSLNFKRRHKLINIITTPDKISIDSVFDSLKKLFTVPIKKSSVDYTKIHVDNNHTLQEISNKEMQHLLKKIFPNESFTDKNCKNMRIISPNNETVGIFSFAEHGDAIVIGNFGVLKKFRKTKDSLKALTTIRDYFKDAAGKTLFCQVNAENPYLVRLYEKLGFEVKALHTLDSLPAQKNKTVILMEKQIPRYDIEISYCFGTPKK